MAVVVIGAATKSCCSLIRVNVELMVGNVLALRTGTATRVEGRQCR